MKNYPWAILLLAVVFLMGCAAKHPKDTVLIADFESHKPEFNHLLEMFREDKKLSRVSYYFTLPENPSEIGISPQRLQEYRVLLDKIDVRDGIGGTEEKDMVWFNASTFGLAVSGTSKGFIYVDKEPYLIVDNLDVFRSKDGKPCTAFRHIEGNWYLYLDLGD